jgi:hypothetical protein
MITTTIWSNYFLISFETQSVMLNSHHVFCIETKIVSMSKHKFTLKLRGN